MKNLFLSIFVLCGLTSSAFAENFVGTCYITDNLNNEITQYKSVDVSPTKNWSKRVPGCENISMVLQYVKDHFVLSLLDQETTMVAKSTLKGVGEINVTLGNSDYDVEGSCILQAKPEVSTPQFSSDNNLSKTEEIIFGECGKRQIESGVSVSNESSYECNKQL